MFYTVGIIFWNVWTQTKGHKKCAEYNIIKTKKKHSKTCHIKEQGRDTKYSKAPYGSKVSS